MNISTSIEETYAFIKDQIPFKPEVGIILGSGLDGISEKIDSEKRIAYSDIPGFPRSTVKGHKGELIFGRLEGRKVMALRGRFHYYEGYSMEQVVLPVRIMAMCGALTLFVSNACGGVNPEYEIGDVMIIRDHINLFSDNPLIGPNRDEWGPRFPDMSAAYNKRLIEKAVEVAKENNIPVKKGVYAGLSGPCLETPAEYKYIHIIGADAVGMSTVPEVIAGRHMGMECFGMSVITDIGVEGRIVETTHDDVVKAAAAASSKLTTIFAGVIRHI